MKIMLQICKQCGFKKKVEIWSQEDARREGRNLRPPCCEKCGSFKVVLE